MALFTDGLPNNEVDLRSHDGAILDIASIERIDLRAKLSLAQDEIATDLALFLSRQTGDFAPTVDSVVLSKELRRWHALKTLTLVYGEAYHSQLNDRYQGRWKEYERLAEAARSSAFRAGLGITHAPLPRPARPTVGVVAGEGVPATLHVAATWVGEQGAESTLSGIRSVVTSPSEQLAVSMTNKPRAAIGWNVYMGLDPDELRRQNAEALAVDAVWFSGTVIATDPPPGSGQVATYYIRHQQRLLRG